jgi:hypothetical protein
MKVTVKSSKRLASAAKAANEAAARAVFAELAGRFQDAIRKPVWKWNPVYAEGSKGTGITIRSNGDAVGSPRNILDQETLAKSQQAPQITGMRAVFRWTAGRKKDGGGYVTAVHEGARLRNGTLLPARPWTRAVLGTEPVDGIPVYDARKRFREVWLKRYRS